MLGSGVFFCLRLYKLYNKNRRSGGGGSKRRRTAVEAVMTGEGLSVKAKGMKVRRC